MRRSRLAGTLPVAEPPHRGRGTHPSGANRGPTATANPRRARQLTSQAKRAASRYLVFRPIPQSVDRARRAVGRNLALDLVAAIGVGVTMALVASLLPTIARRGGLEPIGLAALAAAPFIANLLACSPVGSARGRRASSRSSAALGAASLVVARRRARRRR